MSRASSSCTTIWSSRSRRSATSWRDVPFARTSPWRVCALRSTPSAGESTPALGVERRAHTRQGDVRAKGTSLQLVAERLERELQIVVQELEARLMVYPEPEHACPAETQEAAKAGEIHGKRTV